jgi:hypothetical protein
LRGNCFLKSRKKKRSKKKRGDGKTRKNRKQQLDDLKEKRMLWKHQFAMCGEIALAEAMDLSQDRIHDDDDLLHRYSVNQQMHILRYNCNNVPIRQLLHVSSLTGPSTGSAELHKRVV